MTPDTIFTDNLSILRSGNTKVFCRPLHYPICKLLFDLSIKIAENPYSVMENLNFSPRKVSAKRLNRWIAESTGNQKFLEAFAIAIGKEGEIAQAIMETVELTIIENDAALWAWAEENMHNFIPFIEVQSNQSYPSGIVIEGMTGGKLKRVRWEPRLNEPISVARIRAARACREHLKEFEGLAPNWGRTIGYTFVEAWNRYVHFNLDCEIEKIVNKPYRPSGVILTVKGKEFLPSNIGFRE